MPHKPQGTEASDIVRSHPVASGAQAEPVGEGTVEIDSAYRIEVRQPGAEDQDAPGSDDPVMTTSQKRFYASEQCLMIRKALQDMVDNPGYNTDSDYFNGGMLGFVDRHLYYLSTHATANVDGYLSNLKLMTNAKIRK